MAPLPFDTLLPDTSVWLNFLATQELHRILRCLARKLIVPDEVLREVTRDPVSGRLFTPQSHPLLRGHPIEVVAMNPAEQEIFVSLVSGDAGIRLGDGEAAAIAIAETRRIPIAIDENKGRRVLRQFPNVPVLTSEEILTMPEMVACLGAELAADCFENAKRIGRMHTRRPSS